MRLEENCGTAEEVHHKGDLVSRIMETSPVGIMVIGRDGRITYANGHAERVLGLAKDQITQPSYNAPHWRLTDDEGRSLPEEEWPCRRVMRTGRAVRAARLTLEWPDGQRKLLSINAAPLLDKSGQVIRVVAALEELTERVQAENALRGSQERYRQLFESVNDAVFLRPISPAGSGGSFTEVNGVACQWLGYSREELKRKFPMDIDADATAEQLEAQARQLAAQGSLVFQTALLTRAGRRIPVEISSHVVEWDGRQMMLSIARDLTERQTAEVALRESKRRFREMMENMRLIAIMLDAEGKILFVNRFLLHLTGWTIDEVVGKDWFELFIPLDQSVRVKRMYGSFIQRTPMPQYENDIITRLGERRAIAWNLTALKDPAGNIIGVASIGEDITERRHLEEQLRQGRKMEALGQLAGGVAHDFNNILASTLIQLRLLQQSAHLALGTKESLQEMEAETLRAANLTRQLLLFSRRQAAKVETLDLNKLVTDLLKMVRRLLRENIEVTFQGSGDAVWVRADLGMIEQVVMNLSINARDAMPTGGRLTLAITRAELPSPPAIAHLDARLGCFVCLSVTDTGCGMDETVLKRIFEPFFTTKEVGKGTGLGLATVFGIVKQHEGWVEVDSAVGRGSSFRVYLPAGTAPFGASAILGPEEIQGGSETILLVEDELSLRRAAALCLRKLGYAVLEAGNGLEALNVWKEHQQTIALLFTDMLMPGAITGLDLVERLRKEKSALKAIISSGYAADPEAPHPAAGQEITYLSKPYQAAALAKIVRRCLDRT